MKRFLILFCLAFSVSCMYAADRYSVKETPTLTKQPILEVTALFRQRKDSIMLVRMVWNHGSIRPR